MPIIRQALPDDVPAIAKVFAEAIEIKARDSYGPRERAAWAARGTAERFGEMLLEPEHRLYVAEWDGAVVGVGGLHGSEVSLLYAASQAPSGTGTRLLAWLEQQARRQGATGLSLCASRNALTFYLRHGFTVVRLANRPLPGGAALPVCLMAKVLPNDEPPEEASRKMEIMPA